MLENRAYVLLHPDTMSLAVPAYWRFLPVVRDASVPVGMVYRIDPRRGQELFLEMWHGEELGSRERAACELRAANPVGGVQ